MKKIITVALFVFLAFGVYAQTGVIQQLSGTVEVKAPGAASFTQAKTGDRLNQDTVISTGFKSTALIEVGSSVLTVRPLTRLSLMEIHSSSGVETLNVNLQAGRVRVDVNPPAGTRTSMSVRSPTATASVRGTSFEFDTRNLRVRDGRVSFMGNQGRRATPVNAGFTSWVGEDGNTADPITVKNSGFKPPAPSGTESSAKIQSSHSGSPGGAFTIMIDYPDLD